MTKTFWVASKRPTPNQMAAIHSHRDDPEGVRAALIPGIVFYDFFGETNNAANRLPHAVSGLAPAERPVDTAALIAKEII